MAHNFRPLNRRQFLIFKPTPIHFVRPEHEVWFVMDLVKGYDLSPILGRYREDGQGGEALDPLAMTQLLAYTYFRGVRSSRKIEMLCDDSLSFRAIFPTNPPDHSTISRFRKDNWGVLQGLFTHVLAECRKAGLVDPETGIVDGTKMKAAASLEANTTLETVEKKLAHLEAEEQRTAETEVGLPPASRAAQRRGRTARSQRLEAARQEQEKKNQATVSAHAEKQEKRAKEEAETGRRTRGRKPGKGPTLEELSREKVNATDPDSRIMKGRKGYVQGYNAQIMVTTHQIILAAEVTQDHNDTHQLLPMVEKTREELEKLGCSRDALKTVLADAGYCTDANLAAQEGQKIELLSPPKKDAELRALREAFKDKDTQSEFADRPRTTREGMAYYLATDCGHARYKVRGTTVEPTFGQIKEDRDADGFMVRGLPACRAEWRLICAMHNLRKLWAHTRAQKAA